MKNKDIQKSSQCYYRIIFPEDSNRKDVLFIDHSTKIAYQIIAHTNKDGTLEKGASVPFKYSKFDSEKMSDRLEEISSLVFSTTHHEVIGLQNQQSLEINQMVNFSHGNS